MPSAAGTSADELLADFLEVYHIDVWGVDWDGLGEDELARYAALAFQLRPSSRTRAALDPAGSHAWELLIMRRIEHDLRLWIWSHSENAKNKDTAPDPIWLPGEEERHERMVEDAKREAARIADAFGIAGT